MPKNVLTYSIVLQQLSRNGSIQIADWHKLEAIVARKGGLIFPVKLIQHQPLVANKPLIFDSKGNPKYIETIFYMVNYTQEYASFTPDQYGRFPYSESYQNKYDCIEEDLVSQYFQQWIDDTPEIRGLIEWSDEPSRFILTHDIDGIRRGRKTELLTYLRQANFVKTAKQVIQMMTGEIGSQEIEEIVYVESHFGYRSIFFFIPNQQPDQYNQQVILNGDYEISDSIVQNIFMLIDKQGSEIGLHRSFSAEGFNTELQWLNRDVLANRNHYLKCSLPDHFEQLDQAGIKIDFTMGFPEKTGFRNSYSQPVKPIHPLTGEQYNVILVPLNIMDASYYYYNQLSPEQVERKILGFIEKHSKNALLVINWHNEFFSEARFPGYAKIYLSILKKLKQLNCKNILSKDVLTYYG